MLLILVISKHRVRLQHGFCLLGAFFDFQEKLLTVIILVGFGQFNSLLEHFVYVYLVNPHLLYNFVD